MTPTPTRLERVEELFLVSFTEMAVKYDRMFGGLLLAQWLFAVGVAIVTSPKTYTGASASLHPHVYAAVFLGGILAVFPAYFNFAQPGRTGNRFMNATAQILFSMLLVDITGGRLETHFHIFGSLAFLACYRDWRLIAVATVITCGDHLIRGLYWPEAIYGALSATVWRSMEHSAWVAFEDIVLLYSIFQGVAGLRTLAAQQADLEIAFMREKTANREATAYRYALDHFAIVCICDLKGVITYANANLSRISGYASHELIGKLQSDLRSEGYEKSTFEELWRTIRAGRIWAGEILCRAKNGSAYWVDVNIVPLFDDQGEIKEYLSIQNDISARKQLERDLKDLNHSLEETVAERTRQVIDAEAKLLSAAKMSSLGEMAGGVAHEINTPLAAIGLLTEQLEIVHAEEPFNRPRAGEFTAGVLKTVERISKIVKGLRTFSRDGSRDSFVPVCVATLIDESLSLCNERIRHNGVRVDLAAIDKAIQFDGRSTEISQVIVNLLGNADDAIKALDDKWIRVEAEVRIGHVEISVTDSGSGIPAEVRKSIFQPFFTTKGLGKGTGLGLSISHGIVRQHGGELLVDEKCANTRFVLRLPLSARASTTAGTGSRKSA